MQSVVVAKEYLGICAICGRPREADHHLIFGNGMRPLAESDGIKIPCCNQCHNMADTIESRIHDNPMAEALSKIAGQLAWEKEWYKHNNAVFINEDPARDFFRNRYGRSYL